MVYYDGYCLYLKKDNQFDNEVVKYKYNRIRRSICLHADTH